MANLGLAAAVVLLAACNDNRSNVSADAMSPPDSRIGPLCDGSDEVRLDARLRATALEAIEHTFATDEGVLRLRVTGRCRYWVNHNEWFSRHGELSSASEARLLDALHYEELPALEGSWNADRCFDPPTLEVSAQGYHVECVCNCGAPGTPAAVQDLNASFDDLVAEFATQGERWEGAAWVLVVRNETLEDRGPVQWALTMSPSELETPGSELSDSEQPPDGVLLDDYDELARLRNMMAAYAEEFPDRDVLGDPLPVTDGGRTYGVYVRDVYEEAP